MQDRHSLTNSELMFFFPHRARGIFQEGVITFVFATIRENERERELLILLQYLYYKLSTKYSYAKYRIGNGIAKRTLFRCIVYNIYILI